MKLKENWKNIYANHKRVLVAIFCSFIFLVVVSIIVGYQYHVKKVYKEEQRNKYIDLINDENVKIEEYNNLAKNMNMLIDYFKDNTNDVQMKPVPEKSVVEEDFDLYFDNGCNDEFLKTEISQCINDIDSLRSDYYVQCSSYYNSLIEIYNSDVNKYNVLLDKILNYNISNITSEIAVEKNVIDESDNIIEWYDFKSFLYDYESLLDEDDNIKEKYFDLCCSAYNNVVSDFNTMVGAYNDLLSKTSVDFIDGMNKKALSKIELSKESLSNKTEDEVCSLIEYMLDETDNLLYDFLVASQITNPDMLWVKERLENISDITGNQNVSLINDPNKMLGKKGGYTSCVYFTVNNIDVSSIPGESIVDKGTDAGGAIEVYADLDSALIRCDYLSQFDGTLLYSGSYVIIGTMVVRTSYKLTDEEQIELTNKIVEEFTRIE